MMPPIADGVHVHVDMPASEYHADPCPKPSLSSTRARAMVIDGCALMGRPGVGDIDEHTKAKDEGALFHELLLLDSSEDVEILDYANYRTKAAQTARREARDRGKVPILRKEWESMVMTAAGIKANLEARTCDGDPAPVYLQHAPDRGRYSELTILHQLTTTHAGPIWVRARLDHVEFRRGGIIAYDLKVRSKRGDAHPRKMAENIAREGYAVQSACYTEALEAAFPAYAGRVVWVWVFVESKPPYAVTAAEQDGLFKAHGVRLWREACEAWARGVHLDEWPGYYQPPILGAPGWLEHKENQHG
jgi:hypothetical protein